MKNKHLLMSIGITLFSLGIMWLPFALRAKNLLGIDFAQAGMDRIVSNFDGINFLVVAKTAYNPELIANSFQDILNGRRPLYFSAHYPGYPMLIALIDIFVSGPNALLGSVIVSNILLSAALYLFFESLTKNREKAILLTLVALFFPARMLSNRIVGSNESLFIFFILSSLIAQMKNRKWWSAVFGVFAVLTRSPGILLFGAYFIQFIFHNLLTKNRKDLMKQLNNFVPYLLIPLALIGLWIFYGHQFGSIWAYFQVGGNINIHWPFSVFGSHMDWVTGIWNEDLIYLFTLIIGGGIAFLHKYKWNTSGIFVAIYGLFVIFVAHRDLARYSLPIMPFVIAGLSPILEYRYIKYIILVMIIPICLYAWQFVLVNYQPIMDWTRLL